MLARIQSTYFQCEGGPSGELLKEVSRKAQAGLKIQKTAVLWNMAVQRNEEQ
jgi:hypothetical protein